MRVGRRREERWRGSERKEKKSLRCRDVKQVNLKYSSSWVARDADS